MKDFWIAIKPAVYAILFCSAILAICLLGDYIKSQI